MVMVRYIFYVNIQLETNKKEKSNDDIEDYLNLDGDNDCDDDDEDCNDDEYEESG